MMRKYLSSAVAFLLAALLLLTGCDAVTKELDQRFPEASVTEKVDLLETALPDRTGRTYVILLTTQVESADTLSGISLLTFQTVDEAVHWLELPADLYVRTADRTLGDSFRNAYLGELAKESGTTVSATAAGIDALRSLLSTGFCVPIDYSVNFDPEQFADFLRTIENVPITLPEDLGGLQAGDHTLTPAKAAEFLTYDDYTDPTEGQFEARKRFAAALWQQVCKVITTDNLSLYSMELRGQMSTDIPNAGGEDMFFLRRFIRAKGDAFHVTHISTQSVVANGKQYRVLIKDNALRQLNRQMLVYQEEIAAEQFDPSAVFVDHSNQVMKAVYLSSTVLPPLYSMNELLGIVPETPETEEAPATEPATNETGAADE